MSHFFKKILIVLFLLNSFLSFSLYKQDSLLRVLDTAKNNKVVVKTMMNLWYYHYEKNDLNKAFDWIQRARKYALSINDSALIFSTTANMGVHYDFCQNYGASLYNYKLALKFIKKNKQYYDRLINMRLIIANTFKKTKQLDRVKNEFDSIEVYLNKLDKIKNAATFFSFYTSKGNYYKENSKCRQFLEVF